MAMLPDTILNNYSKKINIALNATMSNSGILSFYPIDS
jgi:hypothetical protein